MSVKEKSVMMFNIMKTSRVKQPVKLDKLEKCFT